MVGIEGDLALLIHLMSAGRLQLFDTRASLRDRTSRLLLRLDDGRELRLREFGTKQAAWVKLLTAEGLEEEETIATLGPEAFPDPPPLAPLLDRERFRDTATYDEPRRYPDGVVSVWVAGRPVWRDAPSSCRCSVPR